jgi:hypothetical protein
MLVWNHTQTWVGQESAIPNCSTGMQGHAYVPSIAEQHRQPLTPIMLMDFPTITKEEIAWEFKLSSKVSFGLFRPWYSIKNFVPAVFKII